MQVAVGFIVSKTRGVRLDQDKDECEGCYQQSSQFTEFGERRVGSDQLTRFKDSKISVFAGSFLPNPV
jgi:hypothetical protein